MTNQYINQVVEFLKPYTPYIMAGLIGAIVHRMRNEMTIVSFLKTSVTGMFVSVCTGILANEYLGITNINVLFAICGLSSVFSKNILDEIEPLIKSTRIFLQSFLKSKK